MLLGNRCENVREGQIAWGIHRRVQRQRESAPVSIHEPGHFAYSEVCNDPAKFVDEPQLLHLSNKTVGKDQTSFRMLPPGQGLNAAHTARRNIDLGLMVHNEFIVLD